MDSVCPTGGVEQGLAVVRLRCFREQAFGPSRCPRCHTWACSRCTGGAGAACMPRRRSARSTPTGSPSCWPRGLPRWLIRCSPWTPAPGRAATPNARRAVASTTPRPGARPVSPSWPAAATPGSPAQLRARLVDRPGPAAAHRDDQAAADEAQHSPSPRSRRTPP